MPEETRCNRCRSLKHTSQEHNARLVEARRRRGPEWREGIDLAKVQGRFIKAQKENWAKRTDEERAAIAAKISASQKGRPMSAEHLANLRAANSQPRSAEHRRKLGAAHIGKPSWSAGLTKDTHPSLRSNSDKQKGRIPAYGKFSALYEGPNGAITMRSTWEVAYAHFLDEQGVRWEYEPRWFNIGAGDYTGVSYTPDFYLPDEDRYIEIKGHMSGANRRKMARFRECYPQINIEVLARYELRTLGVIDKHGRVTRTQEAI